MFDKKFDNFLNDRITDFSEISKEIWKKDITKWKNLDNLAGISIGIANPEQIKSLSHGKVLISETINYRTQRPERWWLFCEQIFGPRKNFECACWKYKRIRYKWVVCERCWVEITKSSVRRDRMGHIQLYSPVAHIWYLKSVPSRIGLFLDLPVKKLEQVVYFASYIITDVYEDKLEETMKSLEEKFKVSKTEMQKELQKEMNNLKIQKEEWKLNNKTFKEQEIALMAKLDELTGEFDELKKGLKSLKVWAVIWELEYRMLNSKFPHVFKWWTWAEYLRMLLERIDLAQFIEQQQKELRTATQIKKKKILQKIKLASNLFKSSQRPEWFILDVLPIIPPDLRPMIQLDWGRFASSDLNDLYRRVINRNNRLKKLIELWAPEVILKNEKRMLQESVDMLITGETRSNRSWFVTANRKKLKSLTEILKWKQGRFRQNLLWKRVDYSARSVIVVWPTLKMDECWIPSKIASILFKPFIISKLIEDWVVYNVKHAEKYIDSWNKEVWDALDEVIEWKYILLNRAPTLHRLSIQAFKPVLIEWKAIQLHPLTCTAFNADFDGDQMAIHLPLTQKAQDEARDLMVTSKNLLSSASWEPIVTPSQDMILGCYYITSINKVWIWTWWVFASMDDVSYAYDAERLDIRALMKVRLNWELVETTYGRLLFNEIVPEWLGFINEQLKKWVLKRILSESFEELWAEVTAKFVNEIKDFWYKYATISGLSISKEDMVLPENKWELIEKANEKVKYIQKRHWTGFMTEEEKYFQSVAVWAETKKVIESEMKDWFEETNHIFNLIDSWARWNWWNVTQLCWMKWLVASTTGKTIELPIKSTLKEWFSTLEYFIATHGWRKGKSDTALKTAQSWYLTRRLVDSSQNIIVKEEDCATLHSKEVSRNQKKTSFSETFEDMLYSHTVAKDIKNSDGELVVEAWTIIDKNTLKLINKNKIEVVFIRNILTCETEWWVCKACYWLDLWLNKKTEIWTPVWVIAAQSIWEPWTQLTMRTFHSWWVAKEWWDMTQWLARVEELFEARIPKVSAEIADIDWTVDLKYTDNWKTVILEANTLEEEEYYFWEDFEIAVKQWQEIKAKQIIARNKERKQRIISTFWWKVQKVSNWMIVVKDIEKRVFEYKFDLWRSIMVEPWEKVKKWQKITDGYLNLNKLMNITWVLESQKYIVWEIKSIYASQWQTVNSKHIEIVVRQMFSRVRVLDKWNTEFFPWDVIDIIKFNKANDKLLKEGKKPWIWERLLLGITKISLHTESWLSAASFQETVRWLVESSVSGKIDKLLELKENVIIGRLIPAGRQYRKIHNEEIDEDNDYFDISEDSINTSEQHYREVETEIKNESDF